MRMRKGRIGVLVAGGVAVAACGVLLLWPAGVPVGAQQEFDAETWSAVSATGDAEADLATARTLVVQADLAEACLLYLDAEVAYTGTAHARDAKQELSVLLVTHVGVLGTLAAEFPDWERSDEQGRFALLAFQSRRAQAEASSGTRAEAVAALMAVKDDTERYLAEHAGGTLTTKTFREHRAARKAVVERWGETLVTRAMEKQWDTLLEAHAESLAATLPDPALIDTASDRFWAHQVHMAWKRHATKQKDEEGRRKAVEGIRALALEYLRAYREDRNFALVAGAYATILKNEAGDFLGLDAAAREAEYVQFRTAQLDALEARLAPWAEMATASEKWQAYRHYAVRAKFAMESDDPGGHGRYLELALDAVERTLAEHPGDPLCPDLQMARHAIDRELLGAAAALAALEAEVEGIWRSFADAEQRHAFAKLLRDEAGAQRKTGDTHTMRRYDRIVRDQVLASLDADPGAPIQVRMVELYANTLERTKPLERALGEGPSAEKTLPHFDSAETVAERRAAMDTLAERMERNPDSATGFMAAYTLARFEQDLFHDTARSKDLHRRMLAILESGAVDQTLAEAHPLGEDSAVLHVVVGHCYAANGMADTALAQYRYYLDEYPGNKGPVPAAKLGLLYVTHNLLGSTLEERHADLRAYIGEFHTHGIAETVAGQMGMELAASGDHARAAELWMLLAEKRRNEGKALKDLQRAIEYYIDAGDVQGAVALYMRFMGAEADPEDAADIVEQAAMRCLAEADAAGAKTHFEDIVSRWPGTQHAATAQDALERYLQEAEPAGAIALYAAQADLVTEIETAAAILDRAATLCLMQEDRDAAQALYRRLADAYPDTPNGVNAKVALGAFPAGR